MNEDQLSKRLGCVASYIEKGMRIADIGSDHAYLPCYAIKNKVASFAVAGEIADGPYQSALNQVKKLGLEDTIKVRKGDGLEVIQPGEVDCIIIAGMGGPLITHILETGKDKLSGVSRLILQPNVGAVHIRKWLVKNQWELIGEEILKEDGKIYEILVSEKGEPLKPYRHLERELLLGPFLSKDANEAFREKWAFELKTWEHILNQLEKAKEKLETAAKKKELENKIAIVKEVLSSEKSERT